jgi:hypothetical protein
MAGAAFDSRFRFGLGSRLCFARVARFGAGAVDALAEGMTNFSSRSRREPHGVTLPPVTVSRTRGVLYQLARFLGDYQAVRRGQASESRA